MSSRSDPSSRDPGEAKDDQALEELRDIVLRGNQEYLIETVQSVLNPALAREIKVAHDEVSRTLAPVIGSSVRHQIRDAQDEIIDALYPIIGKTIRRAVAEAMRDLARRVDQGLRNPFNLQRAARRIRARMRGVSEAELYLREALPFRVQELFLIHRDSGILLAHLSAAPSPAGDRDLVSGLLTAIRDFAQDAFGKDPGSELDAIEYGPLQILLEPGPAAYLATVVDGVAAEDLRRRMQDALAAAHEAYSTALRDYDGDSSQLSGLEEILRPLLESPASGAVEAGKDSSGRRPWLAIVVASAVVLLCLSLACLAGWRLTWGRPISTPTYTPLPSATSTTTALPMSTATPTLTPTSTSTLAPTVTPTPTLVPTATPTATSPIPYVGVMIGNVWLRAEPRMDSPLTGARVDQGRPVEISAIYDDWYQIRWPPGDPTGTSGWVPARWVGLVAAPPLDLVTPSP